MYLKKIEITPGLSFFDKAFGIGCKNLNLLVGDQGTGKSTLLEGLQMQANFLNIELTEQGRQGVETMYFDTEKMNPRMKNLGHGAPSDIVVNKMEMCFQSHGEALQNLTVKLLRTVKNKVIFLDEPESALSLRNQYKLCLSIETAIENKCQLFIATHCLPIIEHFGEVFNMEIKSWQKSKDFILSQRQTNF